MCSVQVTGKWSFELIQIIAQQRSSGRPACIIDDNLDDSEAEYSFSNGLDILQIKH
jgi:hypothetical protein